MLNIQLQIPGSNIKKYAIRFPQNKQISELIEWIYDNFNAFLSVDKKKIKLCNQINGQNYSSSNQLLSSCLRDNDFLVITEIQSEKYWLELILEYQGQPQEIKLEDDITIYELMEFSYCTFNIPSDVKIDMVYENINLSNQKNTTKLVEFHLKNNGRIKVIPIYKIDYRVVIFTIACKDKGGSFKCQLSKSDTLIDVVKQAKGYLGLDDNIVQFSVMIKGKYYNDEKSRKQTLAEIKLENDDVVEIKILYSGGK